MNWETIQLGKVAKVLSGYAFKSKDFKTKGIPIVKIKNIREGYVDISPENTQYVEETMVKAVDKKFQLSKGDVLISLTGSNINLPNSVVGRVALYQKKQLALLNQRAGKIIVKNPDKYDSRFLYYYLTQFEVKREIANFGHGGANQVNVSPKNIESISIPFPALPIQRKIAAILSTYDDLIENNLQRIRLLEEAAQLNYKEWFVHLRFPGWEEAEVVDGVPRGWKKVKLIDLYDTSSGGTPSRKKPEYFQGDINWFKTRELNDSILIESEEHITENAIKKSSAKKFPSGTVLIAMYGATIGKLGVLTSVSATNQACCAIIQKSELYSPYFIYSYLLFARNHILGLRMGAAQENISQTIVKNLEMVKAADHIHIQFNKLVSPIFEQMRILILQNQKLQEARDILLPRLMNGTIDVSQKKAPEQVAPRH